MGAPSQAQIHAWTDRVAALAQKNLTGFEAELSGAANNSLWDQVDTSGDPAVESALLAPSLEIDQHSLPASYQTALTSILGRQAFRGWALELHNLITSSGGGAYTGLQPYLAAVSAQVHPLFAELARQVLGETVFDNAGDITEVFAPNYQSRTADRVYQGIDGALADETADAASVGTGDITLFTANNHALYIGSRYKFSQIVAALSTLASASITPTVQYWNGNAWTNVTGLTDNSTGFSENDTIKWTLPADWVRSFKDASGAVLADRTPLYYIRIARTNAAAITAPVGTMVRLIPAAVFYGTTSHLGVDQPPLALCRITAANTIVVEAVANVDYARFREPGLRLRALTPIAAAITPSLSYTNQAGVVASQAQGAWAAPAAGDTVAVTLAGGDTGAQSIPTTGHSIVTTATQGVFEIYAPELRTPAL